MKFKNEEEELEARFYNFDSYKNNEKYFKVKRPNLIDELIDFAECITTNLLNIFEIRQKLMFGMEAFMELSESNNNNNTVEEELVEGKEVYGNAVW